MKAPYSFSVLRYVHDSVAQEFVNIGVAVYSKESRFLGAKCTRQYARITRMFDSIDGIRFRQLTRHIEEKLDQLGARLPGELPFEPNRAIENLLARVLPPDDSSIQFSPAGVGLSQDLERTTAELFDRYVNRYTSAAAERRSDNDIWNLFRRPLDELNVTNFCSTNGSWFPTTTSNSSGPGKTKSGIFTSRPRSTWLRARPLLKRQTGRLAVWSL